MDIQYRAARHDDYDKVVDFINMVFSMTYNPTDFTQILPKLYAPHAQTMPYHFLAERSDGSIRAIVGCFPFDMSVGGCDCLGYGIGAVSVHPSDRGQGYMKHLMQMALDEMDAKGAVFSVLAGLRQRYEHFGYIPAGQRYEFVFNRDNGRHALNNANTDLEFVEITGSDHVYLDEVVTLYEACPVHIHRPREQFVMMATSWHKKMFAALDRGQFVGYIVSNPDFTEWSEVLYHDTGALLDMIASLLIRGMWQIRFSLTPFDIHTAATLSQIAEQCTISHSSQFRIQNFGFLIEQMLKTKTMCVPTEKGRLILEIEGMGRWEIVVREKNIAVTRTDIQPELILSYRDAVLGLFGHMPVCWPEGTSSAVRGWFPLPLYWHGQDSV